MSNWNSYRLEKHDMRRRGLDRRVMEIQRRAKRHSDLQLKRLVLDSDITIFLGRPGPSSVFIYRHRSGIPRLMPSAKPFRPAPL
jgi:hypothetical protein